MFGAICLPLRYVCYESVLFDFTFDPEHLQWAPTNWMPMCLFFLLKNTCDTRGTV